MEATPDSALGSKNHFTYLSVPESAQKALNLNNKLKVVFAFEKNPINELVIIPDLLQWTSFLSAASTSIYVYLYSLYYFFFKTK